MAQKVKSTVTKPEDLSSINRTKILKKKHILQVVFWLHMHMFPTTLNVILKFLAFMEFKKILQVSESQPKCLQDDIHLWILKGRFLFSFLSCKDQSYIFTFLNSHALCCLQIQKKKMEVFYKISDCLLSWNLCDHRGKAAWLLIIYNYIQSD